MRNLLFTVITIGQLALSSCIVDPHGDPHRGWWEERHRAEAYDHDRAEREHRDYCRRSYDRSCEGWYKR
ncbi:MAG TPA: hypothetical protein VH985_12565 [Candidatus Binatia bacterium]